MATTFVIEADQHPAIRSNILQGQPAGQAQDGPNLADRVTASRLRLMPFSAAVNQISFPSGLQARPSSDSHSGDSDSTWPAEIDEADRPAIVPQ